MKKIVAFTLALSMIVLFSGCRNCQNNCCRWTPFKRDQTVCYTPCNSCDIPVVDDCCPCAGGGDIPVVTSGCSSCAMGGTMSTSTPVIEPIPGN